MLDTGVSNRLLSSESNAKVGLVAESYSDAGKNAPKRTSAESPDVDEHEQARTSTAGEDYRQHDRFWYDDRMIYLAVRLCT